FTGAAKRHEGRFERANGGTLFLDELANTPAMVQEKLLRVIEYGEFERVGGSRSVKVDVRLICATNEDLPSMAELGEFRADLLDRLAFDVITLPPMRERQEDILVLAEHFAVNMARELGFELFSGFSEKAKRILLEHEWPGNVRELKNVVERSVYRTNNPYVPVHHIQLDPFESPFRPRTRVRTLDRRPPPDKAVVASREQSSDNPPALVKAASAFDFNQVQDFKVLSENFEMDLIKQALAASQFNQKKTAEALNLTYHQLRGYMKKYKLLDSQQ
ncbi:MAG: sigma 54-interacting transcriptional regulator, partial [Pararheinheimera sp.]|nr:sigma 54-interacting transcriptional regulator [Rheinheimera sp.]